MSEKRASKLAKAARARRVAASLAKGKSVARIAREERVSRATASRAANSPEVRLLITALVEAEGARIKGLFARALTTVEESFSAQRFAVFEGAKVDLGPDHYARLTGVKCLTALLTAGRQAQKPEPPPRKTLTLEELDAAIKSGEVGIQ